MVEYWSEDHEQRNWKTEMRRLLGDKLIGLTIRGENRLIEIRTTVKLEPSEINEIRKLTDKNWEVNR